MKISDKVIVKLVAIFLLVAMVVTFTQCVPQAANEIGDGASTTTYSPPHPTAPKAEAQIINEIQVDTGVKNHEQILHTMGVLTGIDPFSNNGIMNVYRQVEMSLPTDNDIKVFSSTQQVAITKLAAEFCFVLSGNGTLRSNIWPGFQFGQSANSAFRDRPLFIDQTIEAFWGPMLSAEELDVAHEDLDALITILINNQNNTTATTRTVRGVCTAVLSSSYVTLL
jgi:hypothetical protein